MTRRWVKSAPEDELTEMEQHIRRQRLGMAIALERTQKVVYPGTVSVTEKAARRKKGKAQRAARKVHR
jgi:hypothetical protein